VTPPPAVPAAQAAVRALALVRVRAGATVVATAVPAAVPAAPVVVWAVAMAAAPGAAVAVAAEVADAAPAAPLVRVAPASAVAGPAGWDRRVLRRRALLARGRICWHPEMILRRVLAGRVQPG